MGLSTSATASKGTKAKRFVWVWLAVIIVNLIELFVASKAFQTKVLFAILVSLALIAAGLVMFFFMHLKYERRGLILSLVPILLFILFMTIEMFPDSSRLNQMHPQYQPASKQKAVPNSENR
jgi:cytochrome c oxidase subunit IV